VKECGCKWEGALDGRIIRCKKHAAEHKAERAKKGRDGRIVAYLTRELNARGLGHVVKAAERHAG